MELPGDLTVAKPDAATLRRMMSLRPYVRQSGDVRRDRWSLGERRLLDHLLVCIISGDGVFSVGEKRFFPVHDGDIVWIPPDVAHSMSGTGPRMHLAYIHFDLVFDPGRGLWDAHIPAGFTDTAPFIGRMGAKTKDPLFSKLSGKIVSGDKAGIIPLAREICALHRYSGASAALELSAMMLRLLANIAKTLERRSDEGIHAAKLNDAFKLICGEESARFSAAKFARQAGMSVSHFRRLFRKMHGTSPAALHRKALMRRAQELICYEGLNVSETAERLGFRNIHNFSRAFKNHHGKSPKKMMKVQ